MEPIEPTPECPPASTELEGAERKGGELPSVGNVISTGEAISTPCTPVEPAQPEEEE